MALTFADSITPTGTQNGINLVFTLPNAPSPTGSLVLVLNGVIQEQGVDYTLSGSTITYAGAPSFIPQAASVQLAWYRYSAVINGGLLELQDILIPALRIAGITILPGTTPGPDQFNELIPVINMMMASASLDGHRVFTTQPVQYALTANQKIYTIGPGAELNGPRPISIPAANVIFPCSPQVRWPLQILDVNQWSSIQIQDITGAPPTALYYDNNFDSNGFGNIYLYFQPPTGYTLELYAWQELPDGFAAITDLFSVPPGYAHWMTWKMGILIAGLYPHEAKLSPIAVTEEQKALQAIITLNTRARKIACDPALNVGAFCGNSRPWLSGPFRP